MPCFSQFISYAHLLSNHNYDWVAPSLFPSDYFAIKVSSHYKSFLLFTERLPEPLCPTVCCHKPCGSLKLLITRGALVEVEQKHQELLKEEKKRCRSSIFTWALATESCAGNPTFVAMLRRTINSLRLQETTKITGSNCPPNYHGNNQTTITGNKVSPPKKKTKNMQ